MYSQCIILKVDLNDCIACRSGMSQLSSRVTGLPSYVIYPETSRSDSADIDYEGKFSIAGHNILFNDRWYEKLAVDENKTCFFCLDKFGNVVYQEQIKKLDTNKLKSFINGNLPKDVQLKTQFTSYNDSFQLEFDMSLSRLTIANYKTNKLIANIRSSEFNIQLIEDKLEGIHKKKFQKYGKLINYKIPAFLAHFVSFRVVADSVILMYFQYHNTPDSISENITDDYAIIEYNFKGKLKNVYLIEKPDSIVFFSDDFLVDGHDIYFPFWTLDSNGFSNPPIWAEAKYLAKLSKRNGKYVFNSTLNIKLPEFYVQRKTYSYLSVLYSSFPYVCSYLSPEIVNIKTMEHNLQVSIDDIKNHIKNQTGDVDASIQKFYCYGVALTNNNSKVLTLYRYDDLLYLKAFQPSLNDTGSLNVIANIFTTNSKFIWGVMYPSINTLRITMETKENKYKKYNLPLDLFY